MASSTVRLILLLTIIWCSFFIENSSQQLSTISTDPDDIGFYLYPNLYDFQDKDVLEYGNLSSILNSRYSKYKSLILLIHGFAQNYTLVFPQVVKDAYLQAGFTPQANIIAVDWGKLATPDPVALLPWSNDILASTLSTALVLVEYQSAVPNVDVAAKRVGEFFKFLHDNAFLSDFDHTHCIGMSLGAHVCGALGADLQDTYGLVMDRITGLDPAGPSYFGQPASKRLDPTDATFVDIVHTNKGEFGYLTSLGTVDFYVNQGGPVQPGCSAVPATTEEVLCSHGKAIYYYAKSIPGPFIQGCKCTLGLICPGKNCTTFGEYYVASARGDYYLNLVTSE